MNKLFIISLILVLQGCVSNTMSKDHGKSHDNNLAAQVVNENAVAEGSTAAGMDGIKAGIAIKQYKTADTKNRGERLVKDVAD